MDELFLDERPVLKSGCRLAPPASEEPVLLIPEGVLKLQGPARRILELCDGQRTLHEVIGQLQKEFAAADPARISQEVVTYLMNLRTRGALEFLS
jgi:pyrroloquinoline quinone biosynthesis protein D